MNTTGVISIALLVLLLLFIAMKALLKRRNESDPGTRSGLGWMSFACLAFALIIGIWFVDANIYKIPNPFEGPEEANLRSTPQRVEQPVAPKLKAEDSRPNMDTVRREHKAQLDEYESKKNKKD